MNLTILKRLNELELATERLEIPSLIIMTYDDQNGLWRALEQYTRRDGKGNITRGGYVKSYEVKTAEDYNPPKGYKGTMIIDNIME